MRRVWWITIALVLTLATGFAVYSALPDPHPDDPVKRAEHLAMLALAPLGGGSHVAVNDGSWFDVATWEGGVIPGNGADVVITGGVTVTYSAVSTTSIRTVRINGALQFAHDADSQLIVDTMVVDPVGSLLIGSAATPVLPNNSVRVLFSADTPLDTVYDPTQLSRGLISHGRARIYGADKLDFVALSGDALAGDDQLVLDLPSAPDGWQVGDQLVLGGTYYDESGSDSDNTRYHDEQLTITAINGNQIEFTNNDTGGDELRFDHLRPVGYDSYNLQLYVANTTRNVSFATVDGDTVPIAQRAHVMFMHNADVQVHNAGFYELGRTDKSIMIDDIDEQVDGSPGFGTNVRGRYGLHFHRTGANDITGTPSYATGNAVVGSPGWGIVHHDSYLELEDNVVFDVVGSGIVAEAGNEIGLWRNNIVIKTTGDPRPQADFDNHPRTFIFDLGFNGEAYWVQGAGQVLMEDNIAISSFTGIDIFSGVDGLESVRDVGSIHRDVLPPDLQWIVTRADGWLDVTNAPMRGMDGFTAYNVEVGIVTWNHMRNDNGFMGFTGPSDYNAHYARSRIADFRLWNVFGEGIFTQYSAQIDFVDGLILGDLVNPVRSVLNINGNGRGHGVGSNGPPHELLYQNLRVEGFEQGVRVPDDRGWHHNRSRLVDSHIANNVSNLTKDETGFGAPDAFPDSFEIVNTVFESDAPNQLPIAAFEYTPTGGQGVVLFDGTPSYDLDPDSGVAARNDAEGLGEFGYFPADYRDVPVRISLTVGDNAIVAYGWDWDADGVVDDFGRNQHHTFAPSGTYTVALTVWDTLGATTTVTEAITVAPAPTPNLVVDSTFTGYSDFDWNFNSAQVDEGWKAASWSYDPVTGAARADDNNLRGGIAQVLRDDSQHRGLQRLQLDLMNTEGDATDNFIWILMYGVDGEFDSATEFFEILSPVGAIPMTPTALLTETMGGSSFGWTTFAWDVDLGDGYENIIVQIVNSTMDTSAGDAMALDNVYLGDREYPLAIADYAVVTDSLPITLDLLANDVDLMGDTISMTAVTQPLIGSVVDNGDGTVEYTPLADYVGRTEFTYTLVDSNGNASTGHVTIDLDRIARDDLVVFYDFDEGMGRVVHDRSSFGATNDNTRFHDSAWGDGTHGSAGTFDGDRDFVWLPDSPDLNDIDTTQRTIALWFNADDVASADHQMLYEQGRRGEGLSIYLDDGRVYAGGSYWDNAWETWFDSDQISDDTWHHIALVIDADAVSGSLTAYLDGVEIGSGNATSFPATWRDGAIGNLYEGGSFHDGTWDFTLRYGFIGRIDEFRVYNRVVSPLEIATLAGAPAVPTAIDLQNGATETPQSNSWLMVGILFALLITLLAYKFKFRDRIVVQ